MAAGLDQENPVCSSLGELLVLYMYEMNVKSCVVGYSTENLELNDFIDDPDILV